jgi:hypothetical protein
MVTQPLSLQFVVYVYQVQSAKAGVGATNIAPANASIAMLAMKAFLEKLADPIRALYKAISYRCKVIKGKQVNARKRH